jgi:hypothetical protein
MNRLMRMITLVLCVFALCGCATSTTDDEARFKEQRVEIVAKNLLSEGKAANMEEARARAEVIVAREVDDQKDSTRINNSRDEGDQLKINSRIDGE